MRFPKWVNKPTNKEEKATNRLRYIVGRLAIEFSREGTLMALSKHVGISHTTISVYIKQGKFSEQMAAVFEKTFGKELATKEWLINPMSIKPEGK